MLRYYLIAITVLVIDQLTKWLVATKMSLYESIPLIQGVFYITSHRNRGAAFGILQNQQWLFITVTLVVITFLLVYLHRLGRERAGASWSFALILGGAVGNLLDRVRLGEVVDFFDFRLIHYPIFNVADSAIVIGVILLVIDTFRQGNESEESAAKASATDD
ncbi:signal peptidase II [Polycladomyces subterraneus]|uniref:Lipoprotein signal peptidase n=1 Tax=Polycladomyces subterraneus TaxID=1016997 RepID=A0ABT8ISH1_9BACL|nr:signal peptidase II [Polycladomyces subterraneus]MDN4594989.1 signal peptidase II [Polycladomyces subterraneus]